MQVVLRFIGHNLSMTNCSKYRRDKDQEGKCLKEEPVSRGDVYYHLVEVVDMDEGMEGRA